MTNPIVKLCRSFVAFNVLAVGIVAAFVLAESSSGQVGSSTTAPNRTEILFLGTAGVKSYFPGLVFAPADLDRYCLAPADGKSNSINSVLSPCKNSTSNSNSDEPRTVASYGITAAKFDKWFDGAMTKGFERKERSFSEKCKCLYLRKRVLSAPTSCASKAR